MARLSFRVDLIDATGLDFSTDEGIAAADRFDVKSEQVLKESMNAARKSLRQAAPTRTRKLQRSLRVSKVRQRRDRETGGRIVIGFIISSGKSGAFYHSVTDRRQDTRVAGWWTDALEAFIESDQFKSWQDEVVKLFVDAVRAEFRERARTSWRTNFIAGFPSARIIFEGPTSSLIHAELSRG